MADTSPNDNRIGLLIWKISNLWQSKIRFLLKEYFNDENIIVFMGAGSITNFAHELVS